MKDKLEQIKAAALDSIAAAADLDQINEIRVRYLGKKGELTTILRGMGALSAEERPLAGQLTNEVRQSIESELGRKTEALKEEEKLGRLQEETIDVTLPGRPFQVGRRHPLVMVLDEIKDIFLGLGFEIADGPEVELDYYNFEALNFPPDHPARDMQDSFYIDEGILLRTHTSPVQPRVMEKRAPYIPVKAIGPGKVYRRDDDATHSPMFHQVEGFIIDKNISFSDLKGILLIVLRQMFGEDREIRLRPSFFPFTEPSAEVDVSCIMCNGKGCRVCSNTGWLEILGAGMIHPNVLQMSGYDPEEVTGFAFGIGIERVAMLKYGIDDLRLLFDNDKRFLAQF
ncbi:phenylalanine--tRNA ligase subunit alpha [Phosphitispora fastidiosa]|uniref:phenylalanine--tRNA ligase subunit alpha n=1 Tax=Phosphitispora fastidiosa TaxID=2837202 RepID=UPI001E48165E|nr:phenylalanine--tRNA ligase subunit alpha [Phosphitispora fastidiosa]MBU7007208.1 phenylalanyl-tRNA synthetase alpha chain [Phosphitispora fastidiosa]